MDIEKTSKVLFGCSAALGILWWRLFLVQHADYYRFKNFNPRPAEFSFQFFKSDRLLAESKQ